MAVSIMNYLNGLNLTGFQLQLLVSLIIVLCLLLSVVIIGSVVNYLERLEVEFLAHFMSVRSALCVCNYFTFPGVMLHELCHAFMCFLTGAKVTRIKLFQLADDDGVLGYVDFRCRGTKPIQLFQLAMSSCAPVVFGYFILYFLYQILLTVNTGSLGFKIFIYWLMISMFNHMSMSTQDLKCYFKGWIIVLPVCMALTFVVISIVF